MSDTSVEKLAAALAEIKERYQRGDTQDGPRLLALADAVMELCDDWDGRSYDLYPEEAADALRAAISRGLLGEEGTTSG